MPERIFSPGFVVRRQAAVVEYFYADSAEGFKWTGDPGQSLRFCRLEDAQSVASLVADECVAVPFDEPAQTTGLTWEQCFRVMSVTSEAAMIARRPGWDYGVAKLGGFFRRAPDASATGATVSYPVYTPTADDEAAADWSLIPVAEAE